MKSSKGLQKFTISDMKISKVLSLEKVTFSDLKELNEKEIEKFFEIISERFNKAKGKERDELLMKVENVLGERSKNQIWETNHVKITIAINEFLLDYGRMPTKTEVSEKTGLSRPTIDKHLNDYSQHPEFQIQLRQFRFMGNKLMAKLYQFAMKGDTSAAKLYFSLVGGFEFPGNQLTRFIQTQNNFIQINGMVLSQDSIKYLSQEQLNIIEEVLKAAISQK